MSDKTKDDALDASIAFAEEFLSGDVRDVLLTHIRSMGNPWAKMSEKQQAEKINAIERCAEDVVRRAVSIIARRGFDVIPVKIADFTVKGGAIKGKFEALVTENNVVSLSDHQAHSAVIVLTDASDFIGGREAKPDPDQPDMLGDDDADADSELPAVPEAA